MRKREAVLISVLLVVSIGWLLASDEPVRRSKNFVVKYDCRIAEISVDYPAEVKELCRKQIEKSNNVQN
jgi:hypothetical protein